VDLGIAGRWATVCASSQGLGRACADALAAEGVNLVVNGCEPELVEQAAAEIAATHDVQVRQVTADHVTEAGRDRLIAVCPEPDIVVTTNVWPGPAVIPEEGDDLAAALRMQYMEQYYWAPVAVIHAVLGGMRRRRFGRIVNITPVTSVGHRPVTAVHDDQTGLTAVIKALAAEAAGDNVTINQLVTEHICNGREPVRRMTRRQQLPATCVMLCSAQARYISGVDLRPRAEPRSLKLVLPQTMGSGGRL